jgi:hypothetical protein
MDWTGGSCQISVEEMVAKVEADKQKVQDTKAARMATSAGNGGKGSGVGEADASSEDSSVSLHAALVVALIMVVALAAGSFVSSKVFPRRKAMKGGTFW